MAYCTLDDINAKLDEQELIALTDDDDTGAVDTDKVSAAIDDADALIDSYLAKQYSVPVAPIPGIIRKLSVDVAIYELFGRRGRTSDSVQKRYDDAVTFLKDVSRGVARIPGATSADSSESDDAPTITSSGRIFSRASMEGF